VVVTVEVKAVSINEIVGKFILNIFCFNGSTITTSLGRRKYACEDRIFLS
jgi:hypothetical protein